MEVALKEILLSNYNLSFQEINQLHGGNWGITYEVSLKPFNYIIKLLEFEKISENQNLVLKLLHFLAEHHNLVRKPILNSDREFITLIQIENVSYHLIVFKKLEGFIIEENMDLLTPSMAFLLGQQVGTLHNSLQHFSLQKKFNFWNLQENLLYFTDFGDMSKEIVDRYQYFFTEFENICKIPNKNAQSQVIHGDMHFANMILSPLKDRIGFFDFDDAVIGYIAIDLSFLILDYKIMTLASDEATIHDFVIPLLKGYHSIKPFQEEDLVNIPIIMKILELSLYIQCYPIRDSKEIWIKNFFMDREESVNSNSYIILDQARIKEIFNEISKK